MSLVERLYTGLRMTAGLGVLLLLLPGSIHPPEPDTAAPQIGSGIVTVYVSGAVRKPGVYRLPVGTRAVQAIYFAGGMLPGTPVENLELTQVLQDGQTIHVSPKPTPAPPMQTPTVMAYAPAPGRSRQSAGGHGGGSVTSAVLINQASVDALDALPGIGHKRAQEIVAYRQKHGPFRRIEDLGRIRGLGPKLRAKLRPYLRF